MKYILIALLIIGMANPSFTSQKDKSVKEQLNLSIKNKPVNNMENLVSIIEIPTTDLKRAISFYQSVLSIVIDEMEMDDVKMGIFPSEKGTVDIVLANGADYKPTADGSIIYLNGGEDLAPLLDKIEANGGKILVPKTEISPDMGFFALFTDTEGNKMGIHSTN